MTDTLFPVRHVIPPQLEQLLGRQFAALAAGLTDSGVNASSLVYFIDRCLVLKEILQDPSRHVISIGLIASGDSRNLVFKLKSYIADGVRDEVLKISGNTYEGMLLREFSESATLADAGVGAVRPYDQRIFHFEGRPPLASAQTAVFMEPIDDLIWRPMLTSRAHAMTPATRKRLLSIPYLLNSLGIERAHGPDVAADRLRRLTQGASKLLSYHGLQTPTALSNAHAPFLPGVKPNSTRSTHGDLLAQNIRLDHEGRVLLTDCNGYWNLLEEDLAALLTSWFDLPSLKDVLEGDLFQRTKGLLWNQDPGVRKLVDSRRLQWCIAGQLVIRAAEVLRPFTDFFRVDSEGHALIVQEVNTYIDKLGRSSDTHGDAVSMQEPLALMLKTASAEFASAVAYQRSGMSVRTEREHNGTYASAMIAARGCLDLARGVVEELKNAIEPGSIAYNLSGPR